MLRVGPVCRASAGPTQSKSQSQQFYHRGQYIRVPCYDNAKSSIGLQHSTIALQHRYGTIQDQFVPELKGFLRQIQNEPILEHLNQFNVRRNLYTQWKCWFLWGKFIALFLQFCSQPLTEAVRKLSGVIRFLLVPPTLGCLSVAINSHLDPIHSN